MRREVRLKTCRSREKGYTRGSEAGAGPVAGMEESGTSDLRSVGSTRSLSGRHPVGGVTFALAEYSTVHTNTASQMPIFLPNDTWSFEVISSKKGGRGGGAAPPSKSRLG